MRGHVKERETGPLVGARYVAVAIILAMIGHDLMYGPMAAYLTELFGTRVRCSGASLVYQLTTVFAGGLALPIATLLLGQYGSGAVAGCLVVCCAITVVATWFAPETHRGWLDGRGTMLARIVGDEG